MNKLKISSKIKDLPKIKLSKIQDLQGDLKYLSDDNFNKLKTRLEKRGFRYPLYLWKTKNKYYNLDGNQRKKVVLEIWGDIDLPYIEVEAKNIKEAKAEILAISSQYGKVNKEGFDEFIMDLSSETNDEIQETTTFNFWYDDEIDVDEFFKDSDTDPDEIDMATISFHYTEEDMKKVKEALEKIDKDKEKALWSVLGL